MNRVFLSAVALFGALLPLIFDSALKGAVLLAVATVCALLLGRASAATRHLVWLVAVVALLAVPMLSVALPQWRVLPGWAQVATMPQVDRAVGTNATDRTSTAPPSEEARPFQEPSSMPPIPGSSKDAPLPPAPPALAAPREPSHPWHTWLSPVWAVGCALLLLRLIAAHWLLRRAVRACHSLASSSCREPFTAALHAACARLGIRQRVTLLIDVKRTIPVVWGVFRPRLVLPAEARDWSGEQLRSVLLHELAHIKRRDTLVQWLAQIACALHWWNPLVWLAAWRLHVERERACDDLVLASGVRASTYAQHLLHVATKLSPARWTSACGLAMARKSSLESRLVAVLSEKLNRRSVTSALAGIALLLGAVIAIPIAMLRAAEDQPRDGMEYKMEKASAWVRNENGKTAYVIFAPFEWKLRVSGYHRSDIPEWNESCEITLPNGEVADLRVENPVPKELTYRKQTFDFAKGRIFLVGPDGTVRQRDIAAPVVTDQASAAKLAKLIAATEEKPATPVPMSNRTGKLQPGTVAKLKWGEPVNGLRMALAFPPALEDALLGKEEFYQLVVQNVSEKEVRFTAGDDAPNPRSMQWREGERIVQALSDRDAQKADWKLAPGECGVLWMFTKEERNKDGQTISALLDKDLAGGPRYHVIVNMEIAKAPAGSWTGKLVTGQTRGSADKPDAPAPQHKDARALYEIWQRHARLSGDISGALIGELAAAVKVFIGYNPTWETVPKLNEILPRLDATRDWKPADAIALLDEVAAVQGSPLQTAAEKMTAATIRQGEALPEKFAGVVWGETQPNGLRAAWVLEPAAVEHRMGTALKARLLVQNTGTIPVLARVPTWHQGGVSARDATDAEIDVSGIEWTTMARLVPVRLAPGEFIEISAPGVGLGKDAGRGPWAGPRVGSNVLAKDGTELTLTHGPIPLDGSGVGMREDAPHIIGPGWWQAHIKARLARELPLPASGAKRTHLLDRAVRELFATTPTADEIDAFATDQTDEAFDALVQRLAARADVVKFAGSLPTAPAKFRVLPADPAADKTPRVVLGPGGYPLSGGTATSGAVTLKIVGRPVGDRRTNEAGLLFVDTEATGRRPLDPHKLEVPDGWGTWAIVCRPGAGFFYLLHKGSVRKIDYSNPRKVTDTPATDLPAEFRDEVKRQLESAGVSAEKQAEVFEKPAPPAESPAPKPRIRGKVLKSDGSPAVGVEMRVDDGIERWKFRGPAFPDLPRPVKTADDGTFSIDVPKGAVAENYEVFASSDDFAPLNARVPTGGDVGMMQFEKGSRVTGRVIGLDGAGLAKVGIWCKRLDWRGRGPAPMKLTSTGADGTFSIPPIAMGRHVLQIITRDLGAKELAVAFANQVIEAKDDAPVQLEIRPLPTVDLTLDARVIRANAEFRDFEVRVSGTLPGTKAGDPVAYWTRQETTKLAEGKHTIAVPAGLQNTSIRADGIYMRKGDAPVFIWQRGSDAQPATTSIVELGIMDKPQTISVTVRDAQQDEMFEKPARPATTPEPESAEVGPRADAKPVSKLLFNEDYAAMAVQSEKDVNFVLFYQGDLSSGISEWSSGAKWRFNGTVYLVDRAKTAVAGKNVNKRAISVEYTSDEPKKLYLDGKAYALDAGRVFVLGDAGEPFQLARSMALWNMDDLVKIGDFATTEMKRLRPSVKPAIEVPQAEPPKHATLPVPRASGDWSTEWKALSKEVADSQELADWKPDDVIAWGPEKEGLRSGMLIRRSARLGETVNTMLVLRNVSAAPRDLKVCTSLNVLTPSVLRAEGRTAVEVRKVNLRGADALYSVTLEAGEQFEFAGPPVLFGIGTGNDGKPLTPDYPTAGVVNGVESLRLKFPLLNTGGPETGEAVIRIDAAKTGADAGTPDPKPAGAKLPDSAYPKSGVPLAEPSWPMPPWGEEKDGLSAGIRVTGDARIGGEVKAELWVRNSSAKDVKFSHCPRVDVGMHVVAKDKDGKNHSADITSFRGYPVFGHLLLPPGHIVKVKEFSVKFGAGKNDKLESGWVNLDLTPGDYKLRAVWSDTTSRGAAEGEWTGKLTTGEVDFKLAAANAGADAGEPTAKPPGGDMAKFPDEEYAKDGFPLEDLNGEGVMWDGAESGLSLGYRITGDEWRILGKEVKVELWVHNAGKEDLKFRILSRTDEGLRVKLTDKDGKEHVARMVPNDSPLFGMTHRLSPMQCIKVNEFSVTLLPPEQSAKIGDDLRFFVPPGSYDLVCEVAVPGFTATRGDGRQIVPGAGEWTGTLKTRALNVTVMAPDAPSPKSAEAGPRGDDAALQPKHESSQKLLKSWQRYARSDGKIPGGLIAALADVVDWTLWTDGWLTPQDADQAARLAALRFTHTRVKKTGAPYVAKLTALGARIDGSHDWTPAEAAAMLDELTAITTEPVHLANRRFEFDEGRKISPGKPLPKELEGAAWGAPAENGLRAAWLLEPAPAVAWASILELHYRLGTVLKARVLFHNTGKAPVVFETETWHQDDKHSASDAKGAEIPVKATWFTGITPTSKFRLAPGEYCEVSGHGVAIGAGEYKDEHSTGAVGAIIEAKEGETVTLSHSVDAGTGGWTRPDDLWLTTIARRVGNEAPMPASTADREQLIRRVTLDILGTEATAEEIAAFSADNTSDALAKLTARLQAQPRIEPFGGKLPTGETKFRVIATDPNAAKAPRTATAPGRYVLGDGVHLQITQTNVLPYRMGSRPFLQNKATILFLSTDPKKESPHKPYNIALPGGLASYAFAWERDVGALWIKEFCLLRKVGFTNPAKVTETRYAGFDTTSAPIPKDVRAALDIVLPKPAAPEGANASNTPASPDDEKPKGAATPAELQERYYAAREKRGEPLPVGIGSRAVLIRSLTLDITGELPTQEERNAFEADNAPDALGKVIARLLAKAGKLPPWLLDAEQETTKPEPSKDGAAAHTASAGEFVFITSGGPLPAQPLDAGDGVALELKRITLPPGEKRAVTPPGGKPATPSGVYAILRWPARDGQPALEHGEQIVSDTLDNPGKWAAAWQPGTKTVWSASKDPAQSRPGFIEMTFPDSKQITVRHIGVNSKDSLIPPAMPAGFRAKFGAFFDIAVQSATGQPEYYESEQVHAAVQEDKKLHPGAALGGARLADTGSAEWRVKFEHSDTGKPVTEVRARLIIMDADGSKRQSILRTWKAGEPFHINFDADGVLRVVLTGKQYASIVVEDEKLGGGPVSYFGNIPDSVTAGVQHTKLEEPLVVKVKAREEAAMPPEPVTVDVAKDGSLRINDKAFTLDEVKAAAARERGKPFAVRAHKEAPIVKVLEVVEALKSAGVKDVGLSTAAKLTPDALLGTWRGTVNGEKLMLSFHRPPVERDVQLDIYFGDATIGALAGFTIAADGGSAEVVQHSAGGGMKFGTLIPGEPGKLKLELYGRQKGQQDLMLTRAAEPAATEPQQKEARELFEIWKRTADTDGTIPGTFIGALATEVRAYVKANPNLNSGMALPKLLPRFVTTRDWTHAEAIKLLDDVAYYSTAPIEARVAKATLGSGPMWRTMVEFQDIPVAIAKWSEAKDGLRIGLRVVGGQWSAGGSVRVELWLHNASGKDVSFRTAGPNRQDVEVMFSAIDAEGKKHWPEINPLMLFAPLLDCTLPAGHVAMAKEFDVTFADADNDVRMPLGHRFRDLKPGTYQLRSMLWLAKPEPAKSEEHVELKAPDLPFTLGGTAAADEAKPAAEKPKGASSTARPAARNYVTVRIARDGSIFYERKPVTLDDLKAVAAGDAKSWFTIDADERTPFAAAVSVAEALKAAGVTELSFSQARIGDGKYRVANRTGNYEFDGKHKFSICMPRGLKQWFTVIWPAKDGKLARRLKFYPEADAETQSRWAVVWEPGTDVLWWADDSYVGRMNLSDPTQVRVAREPRLGDFSADFALPEEVKTAFRGLGLAVGRLGQTGPGPEPGAALKEVLVPEEFDLKASDTAQLTVRPEGWRRGPARSASGFP